MEYFTPNPFRTGYDIHKSTPNPNTLNTLGKKYRGGGGTRLAKQKFLGTKLLHGIPQLRRFLKLKLLRSLAHIAFQAGNIAVEFSLRIELRKLRILFRKVHIVSLQNSRKRIVQSANNRLRRNPVFMVVSHLFLAPPIGLIDRAPHRVRHLIGIQNRAALKMTRSTPNRLDQRALRTQEPLFIRIQNRNQRHLRKVETFPQQVDPNQNV